MKGKRITVWLGLTLPALMGYPQVALKTHVAADAVMLPTVGLEARMASRWTVEAVATYNPFKYSSVRMLKLLRLQPELRYWLCEAYDGHFFGLHALGGSYQTTGLKLPLTPLAGLPDDRYKGRFYGAGLSYGYHYPLTRHWGVELTAGLGYARVTYRRYACGECGELKEKSHTHYLGPTKAALQLVYLF